ncbi:hypothetical protein BHAOGJBA_3494 [Methylobacterium hispanicum]|jgi:hypothetical protein|uniref:Uncharacterized protein n=1 Tax=Methylobacterium hispanicum TaxID=270350 RepID=A0AAV4ZN70_9HYPH|nr:MULTISPECIES: hypothetical protein [Methylobacterium]GJD89960.1 hypothetical protein BHAOGJBA_3494 [Methylobacterium hispanicum]
MRLAHVTLAAALALAAGPAGAQVLSNPNATNQALTSESTARGNQIGTTSQNNAARMEMQRSQTSQPPAPPTGAVGAPRR